MLTCALAFETIFLATPKAKHYNIHEFVIQSEPGWNGANIVSAWLNPLFLGWNLGLYPCRRDGEINRLDSSVLTYQTQYKTIQQQKTIAIPAIPTMICAIIGNTMIYTTQLSTVPHCTTPLTTRRNTTSLVFFSKGSFRKTNYSLQGATAMTPRATKLEDGRRGQLKSKSTFWRFVFFLIGT